MKFFPVSLALVACLSVLTPGLGQATSSFPTPRKTSPTKSTGLAVTSTKPHLVMSLDNGLGTLEKRLEMIESAKSRILLETYIIENDKVGRLVMKTLVRKARKYRKVMHKDEDGHTRWMLVDPKTEKEFKIQILLDHYSWKGEPGIPEPWGGLLADEGIELRYFNMDRNPFLVLRKNHRSHRKQLIVDDEVIIGGGNLGVEYHLLDVKFGYLDRDLWVKGEIVEDAVKTFETFWQLRTVLGPGYAGRPSEVPIAQALKHDGDDPNKQYQETLAAWNASRFVGTDFLNPDDQDFFDAHEIPRQIGKKILAKARVFKVNNVSLYSDGPGWLSGASGDPRIIAPTLSQKFTQAKNIVIENYTFIPMERPSDALEQAVEKNGAQLTLLTNSPQSMDEVMYIWRLSYPRQVAWAKKPGVKVYALDGKWPASLWVPLNVQRQAKFSLHAKTFIMDQETCIGTPNYDPRSFEINAEHMICVNDRDFTSWVREEVNDRLDRAWTLNPDGSYYDRRTGESSQPVDEVGVIDDIEVVLKNLFLFQY